MRRGCRQLMCVVLALLASVCTGGGFDTAIKTALPRVVKLYGLGAGVQKGYGTGIIVSPDGEVLTVYSLLIDARVVRAVTADGTKYSAKVLRRDKNRQLALLQLNLETSGEVSADSFDYFDLSKDSELLPGDWVVAAGNSFKVADGAEPVSLAHGVFSVRTALDARRGVKDFIYTGDILVIDGITSNPGAPGSALVDLDGGLVGMVGRVVMSNFTHTHLNYAIPRDVLYDFLSAQDSPSKPVAARESTARDLGIRFAKAGYLARLPFVDRVRRGSPAERAGLKPDDLILSLNGHSISDVADFQKRAKLVGRDGAVDLVIRRNRRVIQVRLDTGGDL